MEKGTKIFVAVWFSVALVLSATGCFEVFRAESLFGLGSVVSATAFGVLHWRSERFRSWVRARNLRWLTYGQLLRLFGILALFKADQKILAPAFAVPTGVLDVIVAAGSVLVARGMIRPDGQTSRGFRAFHLFGLATLATSTILALLTASAGFGLAENGVTSQPMSHFPMSLVPTFIGPLVLVLHLQALAVAYHLRLPLPAPE